MFGYAVGVAVILVLAQIVIEGTRWQLFPAYALTILFSLVWSIRKFVFTGTLPKVHRFNRLLAGSAVGLGTVALAISIALPTFLPVFTFPIPSGPYAIGTVTYHWTDPARREVFGTVPHRSREMMVQIWYPAKQRSSSNGTRYIDDAEAFSEAQARLHNLPTFAFKHLEHVRINASESVRVADAPANYPVLIFVEGITGY